MGLTSFQISTIFIGIGRSVVVAVIANLLAFPIGIAVGMARISKIWLVRFLSGLYIEVFRGTSALVQLFVGYYVLPELGIHLGSMTVGTIVLALNAGAFAAETARGALLAVPAGQTEAAMALNLGWWTTRFRIVLPQAWKIMIPSFGNTAIDVLKGTSFLSLVGIPEVTFTVTNLSLEGSVGPDAAYIGLLVIYFILSVPIALIFYKMERRSRRTLGGVTAS